MKLKLEQQNALDIFVAEKTDEVMARYNCNRKDAARWLRAQGKHYLVDLWLVSDYPTGIKDLGTQINQTLVEMMESE